MGATVLGLNYLFLGVKKMFDEMEERQNRAAPD